MGDDVEAQIGELRSELRAGFAEIRAGLKAIDHRVDDARQERREWHGENVSRLERIEAKQDTTNGNVNRHEGWLDALERRFDAFHRSTHEKFNEYNRELRKIVGLPTYGSMKALGVLVVGTVIATFAVLSAFGWHR